ncbi:putative threonine synthase [Monocercomonoides exilis]|uniref:putative threonine synthase n=1 Tax=Monocercomonoides exilis TaxID=2049356 RepID=UPI00355A0AD1|nr:putative threonine synthase [Monocercomonoides exilis]|eukprot:MONOS_313.1-p1 / transcript=MONOS_313.1 / gene=MONOS_313 / organism=Monocercomonoides_exilis_PA203 / gene_product=threonine synthase / transcript_product=threonine synthase / location=Mono_scaffold00005:120515-121966(-) / protein_length=483 / sequence_SO=supercontig / SO=protein_coding / is_pseudo=false
MDFTCIKAFRCTICGNEVPQAEADETYVCPYDGGNYDVIYDYDKLREAIKKDGFGKEKDGMWRYLPLLPIQKGARLPPIVAGGTPLHHIPQTATEKLLGESGSKIDFYLKDEGRNPTGSLKDRASSLVAAKALHDKKPLVATASTGNAAAALSGICASLGLPCIIFVPAAAPPAKIAQLRSFGAYVFLVDGVYDDAFELCQECTKKFGWYCRSTGYNAYTSEGKKTVSFEICEQLAGYVLRGTSPEHPLAMGMCAEAARCVDMGIVELGGGAFSAPNWIAVSIGDGNIISGTWAGINDLYSLGLINRKPKLLGVQAEGSDYVYRALKTAKTPTEWDKLPAIDSTTVADSIEANLPRDRVRACRAIMDSGGICLTVTDEEILKEIPTTGRETGVFVEPASACTIAGIKKALRQKLIPLSDSPISMVAIMTGTGLKDIAAAQRAVTASKDEASSSAEGLKMERGTAIKIPISVKAVEDAVKGLPF